MKEKGPSVDRNQRALREEIWRRQKDANTAANHALQEGWSGGKFHRRGCTAKDVVLKYAAYMEKLDSMVILTSR